MSFSSSNSTSLISLTSPLAPSSATSLSTDHLRLYAEIKFAEEKMEKKENLDNNIHFLHKH